MRAVSYLVIRILFYSAKTFTAGSGQAYQKQSNKTPNITIGLLIGLFISKNMNRQINYKLIPYISMLHPYQIKDLIV